MLEETDLDIMPAEFPYLSNAERKKSEENIYKNSLDKSPSSSGKFVIQKRGVKTKDNDNQTSF